MRKVQDMERHQDSTVAGLTTLLLAGSLAIAAVAAIALGRAGVFKHPARPACA